ncbi:lamin tail domain-containing protein [Kribbella solani]|uniref:P pilus assembly chaperone PapD n=1 Tax=Kribbella solani TaxID=236067 RepID=A0A841DS32_9ACTN|nr:lamin tail domain-containing protein [Kribbella solani]MBB5980739.1 P pilus assembly chaperone PapD [Kribbella solani]MDX2967586.1 lamin tail domain-containing protein [Kribbella solani]
MSVRRFRTLISAATAAVVLAGSVAIAPLTASAAITVVLSGIQYDPPGPDVRTNAQLNNEFFTVRNLSSRPINLSGYRVLDAANHKFVFPRGYVLPGRTTAIVRTGKNRNRAQTLYWNQGNYIWNNTGDTARFQTPAGKTFDTCTYKAVSGRARVGC